MLSSNSLQITVPSMIKFFLLCLNLPHLILASTWTLMLTTSDKPEKHQIGKFVTYYCLGLTLLFFILFRFIFIYFHLFYFFINFFLEEFFFPIKIYSAVSILSRRNFRCNFYSSFLLPQMVNISRNKDDFILSLILLK